MRRRPLVVARLAAAALLAASCDDAPTGLKPRDFRPRTVAVGSTHGCTLDDAGLAWCWGSNRAGQLGAPHVELWSWTPVAVDGPSFVSISASTAPVPPAPHVTCGLTAGGAAYCWGSSMYGVIPDAGETCAGTMWDQSYSYPCVRTPTRVAAGVSFVQLSVGGLFVCGLTGAGEAWCWGAGYSGQLGIPPTPESAVPVRAAGDLRFAMVSAGDEHACGLAEDGVVWCWGDDLDGQLGRGFASSWSAEPVRVEWPTRFVSIDAGGRHSCGIDREGRVVCWGDWTSGELGHFARPGEPPHGPFAVGGALRYTAVSAGSTSTCALARGGGALCWGTIIGGNDLADPHPAGGPAFTEVSVGWAHACGRAGDDVWCWGDNRAPSPGQLGVGEEVQRSDVPLRVEF